MTNNHKALRTPIRALLDSTDRPDGCFVNIHDRPGPYMVGPRTMRIEGRDRACEDVLGTSFLISPTAFFQTNVGAASTCCRWCSTRARAPLASSTCTGAGLFAIPLARQGVSVVAVEENREAVADAEANLRLNRVPDGRVRLIAARVEDAVGRTGRETFDGVVLDPPRRGCPDRVIDAACGLGPSRIVYVSCNVERLSVERARFGAAGYALARVRPLDMFPHTDHIEAVAVFEPARSGKPASTR
ncbi:MAG: hypothetical protein R2712_28160 [Vicinamibacterales bacterium]